LSLLDEFIEESKAIREFGSPSGVLVDAGVNKFLYKTVLVTRIDTQSTIVRRDKDGE
jgi:hypothetical protein